MVTRTRLAGWSALLAVFCLLVAGFLMQGESSLVDWRAARCVAIESDDWGLAGFVPDAAALDGLDREALHPGPFPAVYWGSTLEDAPTVEKLANLLASVRGRDGLPAVLQPNYVLASLSREGPAGAETWRRRLWPEMPPRYERPGLREAVRKAVADGVWRPEYHALYHYDPVLREKAVSAGGVAAEAARRGVLVFPGSQRAWELSPTRPLEVLAEELDLGLSVFQAAFGRMPGSMIAPDYTWDARIESLWLSRGLGVIQAKREQRFAGRPWNQGARVRKILQQRWERLVHRDRVYLERNCRFEPAQSPDPRGVAAACLAEVRQAWARGEPAIVEAHRVNFVHTDTQVVRTGLETLQALLSGVAGTPEGAPLFLVDAEIAALMRTGTSACRRGDRIVVRNLTHSARVVSLSGAGMPGRVCWAPAGSLRIFGAEVAKK